MNARHDQSLIDETHQPQDDTQGFNPFGVEPWNDDYRCKNHPHSKAVEPVALRRCGVCMADAQARYAAIAIRAYQIYEPHGEGENASDHVEVWKE